MHASMQVYIYVRMQICVYVCINARTYVRTYVNVWSASLNIQFIFLYLYIVFFLREPTDASMSIFYNSVTSFDPKSSSSSTPAVCFTLTQCVKFETAGLMRHLALVPRGDDYVGITTRI